MVYNEKKIRKYFTKSWQQCDVPKEYNNTFFLLQPTLQKSIDSLCFCFSTDSYLYEALKKANKTGFDIVLEVLGHRHVQIVREYLAPRGRIVVSFIV